MLQPRRTLAVVALWAAIAAAQGLSNLKARAIALRLEGPAPSSRDTAERVVSAFVAGDREHAAFLASHTRDPFSVANEMLRGFVEDVVSSRPPRREQLDAILTFAKGGLRELVDAWRGWGVEQCTAEANLAGLERRTISSLASRPEAETLVNECQRANSIVENLPASLSGTLVLMAHGAALCRLDRASEAAPVLERAVGRARAQGWSRQQVAGCAQLSEVYMLLGRRDESVAADRRGLELVEESGDRDGVLDARARLAANLAHGGEIDAAHALFRSILAEQARAGIGDEHRYLLLRAVGSAYVQQSRFSEAIEVFERALAAARGAGDTNSRCMILLDLSSLRLGIGDVARARLHLAEARGLVAGERDPRVILTMLFEIGRSLEAAGKPEESVSVLEQGLAQAEELASPLRPYFRGALGMIHGQGGRYPEALEFLRSAHAEAKGIGNSAAAAAYLDSIGYVLERMGRRKEACDAFESSLGEFERLGLRRSAGTSAYNLSVVSLKLLRWNKASEAARSALDLMIEESRGLGVVDAKGLRARVRNATITGVLATRGQLRLFATRDPAATQREFFWFVEAGNALVLAEEIINRDRLLAAKIPAELMVEREAVRARARENDRRLSLAMQRWTEDPESLREAQRALAASHRALEDTTGRIERSARRTAAVTHPRPIGADRVQAALPPRTALVAYYLSKPINAAVVVTSERVLSIDLPSDAKLGRRLGEMIDDYVGVVQSGGAAEEVLAVALYNALLRPLEKSLVNRDRVLVVPDGSQAFLPLDALLRRNGEISERAIERWEFCYVPSGTVLAALLEENREPLGRGIIALGDPVYPGEESTAAPPVAAAGRLRDFERLSRLPHTGAEVREIAGLFPPTHRQVLLREEASFDGVHRALAAARPRGRLRAFHFACHGRLDTEHPRLTGLALAGGQPLTLDDVYTLDLACDIVVLSACSTARGQVAHGEGVLGLVRGFFVAGCPRVVVSNWPVADDSTRMLMVSFYRHMLQGSVGPSASLRLAKRELLRGGGRTAQPWFWAPFVLWGLPE